MEVFIYLFLYLMYYQLVWSMQIWLSIVFLWLLPFLLSLLLSWGPHWDTLIPCFLSALCVLQFSSSSSSSLLLTCEEVELRKQACLKDESDGRSAAGGSS